MDCVEEVRALERALAGLVDAETLRFDTLAGVMEVPDTIEVEAVVAAVAVTGMRAVPQDAPRVEANWWERHRRGATLIVSGGGVVGGFVAHVALRGFVAAVGSEGLAAPAVPVPAAALYLIAVIAGLILVLPKAWYAARTLRPDMNLLMTLAVGGALGIGQWFEAATVSFLFGVSLALEAWSVGRARGAVEKLLSLAPPRVRVELDGRTEEVDPASVLVGTVFVVKPGERFGLDGVVLRGQSEVDQAPITGESVPVFKGPGDAVYAGTINGNGAVAVRSTAEAIDTTLARIVKMVGEARQDRSDAERWVERFARLYTPWVFASALAVFAIPTLFLGADVTAWFYRALVLLVIGCPCALVISTPVAVVAGLAAAARHGVLIKGGRVLEVPASVRVVALDKTGTLTEGRLRVVDVTALDAHTADHLLATAAAIEAHSEHPVAHAIAAEARARAVVVPTASGVQLVPGKGTTGEVDGRTYWLGSHRWLEEQGQANTAIRQALQERSSAAHSLVVMGTRDHVCGFITLADTVRADAASAVAALRASGVRHVVMLTGDNAATAAAVGVAVGIDDVRAELLPADKVAAIEALERDLGPVAMIGDGVNDAPALARASLGVAMGALGTDIAIETAEVALMDDKLARLAWLITHSRRTLGIIRQNTIFALAVKAVFVVLTFAGVASLHGAIAADMGASLLVVFNALRLLGHGREPAP